MADPRSDILPPVTKPLCNDYEYASRHEWLETNHTGAFAMGTVAAVNTRRYHGLLIASLHPPADRYSVFPRVEEGVDFGAGEFDLATAQYPGIVHPVGYRNIESFSALPCPTWRYRMEDFEIEKSIRLLDGEQSVVLSYRANRACTLRIRIFVSFRDYHSLTRRNSLFKPDVIDAPGRLTVKPTQDFPPLTFHHNAAAFEPDGVWFEDHEYLRELDRGLDFQEDLFSPGTLQFKAAPASEIYLLATLENKDAVTLAPPPVFSDPFTRALDQFRVIRLDNRSTLIAGYPWFTDWSRDTLISLPALIESGFNPERAKSILEFLLAERSQGILPNRFSDQGSSPEYNTVDASLWFFIAANSYTKATGDTDFVRNTLFPAALDILAWHLKGTFYGIKVDPVDHLLSAGEPGTQLTWMDAKIGDFVVTPRLGKPVEINALWFNAIKVAVSWSEAIGEAAEAQRLLAISREVHDSFNRKFWNADRNCLYDVLGPTGADASIRPNQLFAISLPYPLLDRTRAQMVIEMVKRELLTPVGIRTLAPSDPNYRPRFEGDMRSRDSAYHQGTVWPWLLGPFIQAYLYAFDGSEASLDYCRELTESAAQLMTDCCLGSISEVYDAEPPHHPGGCPAQLWSVAQLMLAKARLPLRHEVPAPTQQPS